MEREILEFEKLTDFKWINLFRIKSRNRKGHVTDWILASRKKDPENDKSVDAVVIVPIIDTVEGKKLVVIKEYRVAIRDFEYGFPAGLIEEKETLESTIGKELKEETGLDLIKMKAASNPIYSSPGLSDESCVVVFVEVDGKISTAHQEYAEDIEVLVMGVDEITQMLGDPSKKIGAKAWGIFYYYSKIGRIE